MGLDHCNFDTERVDVPHGLRASIVPVSGFVRIFALGLMD